MADIDGISTKVGRDYSLDVPFAKAGGFYVKGLSDLDWGMKNRLSKIFNPKTGRTVMLAFDHGYILGATSGLERLDLVIPPLVDHVDVLMATRGGLRSSIPATYDKGIALRCSAGSSVADDDMSFEVTAVDIEDAIRMNAHCMAIQTFVGEAGGKDSLDNLCKTIDAGNRYGIATMGVVAVGKKMERTTRFFLLATRMLAELGAHVVKTYYCDNFEQVTASCPVPIVIAGGKKIPEADALTMSYRAIQEGAAGVDMGRNIFQSQHPLTMCKAIAKIVHENYTDKEALQLFEDESHASA